MKILIALALLISSLPLFAQDAGTNAVTTPPPIPEEARKHFVMGTTLFKDAKTPDDYSQVESEFKQATDLAPQWPEARYNLALAKEAAGDYSGAEADLKLYQQFKLSDGEARKVQDKIYVIEAKQEKKVSAAIAVENSPEVQLGKFIKSLDSSVWRDTSGNHADLEIECSGNTLTGTEIMKNTKGLPSYLYDGMRNPYFKIGFSGKHFIIPIDKESDPSYGEGNGIISENGKVITIKYSGNQNNNYYVRTEVYNLQ